MLYNQILVRFGDLTLKGRNKKEFLRRLYNLVQLKLKGLNVEIINTYDRIYINILNEDHNKIVEKLDTVSGLHSYSLVLKCESDINIIKEKARELINEQITKKTTFKVESRRADKKFNLTSQEISKEVAGYVLYNNGFLTVDVHNPQVILHVELRSDASYLYLNEIRGIGGYPVGVAGKGLLMLSGGIDSPVAGFLAQKQGMEIECIHFESTPLTSIESAQKVVDLVKIMAKYAPANKMKIHMVPFKEIHMALLDNIPESYNITIMRRMMYKIAEKIAKKNNCLVLVNGESVGQVASQTLQSISVINEVTNMPIIRPLATYDKQDIVAISRKIGTFTLSIKPFEDCCTVYVPKAPATAPKLDKCLEYESRFDFSPLIEQTVENTKIVEISTDSDLDLTFLGLEVRNVL